ncbi:MAG: cysteine--tRNA ligase [Methylocystis sp.]|uniref:cysteine--tRNA ligase n=1 Tax=Methylocystis sp. TaxID=1911079 RepID=UPI0039499F8C
MSTPALKIYNTLTRTKEEFRPIDPANVRMYVCGPTVYDYAHIGNARPLIVFDVLFRLLRHLYGAEHVTYVRNITDVDDKINARAAERGISIRELTEETNKVFQEDVKALGCLEPTAQPRATEHIAQMIAIIERLIASGHAYAADGHVLFDVPSMPSYGRLSRRSLDEMIAGARVDVAPYKRGDMDFVLWKPSKAEEPGWDSPWGRGRPGWHIECSAMSWQHLGESFDIHGGGIDLVFPHHENEIAQSCCAFGRDVMANYWMHNGFLQVEGEKMSKSLGNFVTIHELLHTEKFGGRSWSGEVLRLAMLKTHYRQPIDFTVKSLEEAEVDLRSWGAAMYNAGALGRPSSEPAGVALEVLTPLLDDLNTSDAVTALHSLAKRASQGNENAKNSLMESCEWLGIIRRELYQVHNKYHVGGVGMASPRAKQLLDELQTAIANGDTDRQFLMKQALRQEHVHVKDDQHKNRYGALDYEVASNEFSRRAESLITARNAARASKNWAESDRIRDELAAMGIALKDNKDGTTSWEVKR